MSVFGQETMHIPEFIHLNKIPCHTEVPHYIKPSTVLPEVVVDQFKFLHVILLRQKEIVNLVEKRLAGDMTHQRRLNKNYLNEKEKTI